MGENEKKSHNRTKEEHKLARNECQGKKRGSEEIRKGYS